MVQSSAVVLSTYNGSKYIVEQVDSILKQSMPVDKIYIFDDKSTDGTVEVLTKRYRNDNKIEIKENKENKGWKRNFIEAIKIVNADFIFIADQDDIWMPDKVEKMINVIFNHPEINLLASNYELYFSEKSTDEKIAEDNRLVKDGKLMKYEQVPFSFYVRQPGCTYLIRKSYFDNYWDVWNPDMPHDSFLWKIALFGNSLYSLNQPLIRWRRHASNESNRSKITKKARIEEVRSNYNFMEKFRYIQNRLGKF